MVRGVTDRYIRQWFGSDLPEQQVESIRQTMNQYDTYWWEYTNPVEKAKYQVFEDTLLMDIEEYHAGLQELLGRQVYRHELETNVQRLREEAEYALYGSRHSFR